MKTAALLLFAFLMPLFLPQAAIAHAQQKPEDLGQKSAKAWLALTDSGKYAESWDQASASFKAAVSKDNWVGMVSSVRGPLGALQSRKLATARFVKNPPHAPEGEYVILRYDTSFEKLPSAVETVSMTLDKDGSWRAVGYFVKPPSQ